MSSIIVKSGVHMIQRSCRWYNIYLTNTKIWDHAIIKINNRNINTLYKDELFNKIHKIEFELIKNMPSLLVNDMIVYQNKHIFDFEVLIQLTTNIISLDDLIISREYKENMFINIDYTSSYPSRN